MILTNEQEFYISERDWNKMQNYAKWAHKEHESEISGMLLAQLDKDNNYRLFKPVILKQEISGHNTTLDQDALLDYYATTLGQYRKSKNKIRFVWWHSHHTMNAFWSGTDLAAMEEFNKGDMSFSLVINLKQEYLFRVNIFKPFKMYKDIEIDIKRKDTEYKIPKKIVEECVELCSKETYLVRTQNHNLRQTFNQTNNGQMTLYTGLDQNERHGWDKRFTDPELVQLEAKVDNMIRDFGYNPSELDYEEYRKQVDTLNAILIVHDSELRVGYAPTAHDFQNSWFVIEAEDWIYRKGELFNYELILEDSMDFQDIISNNNDIIEKKGKQE